MKKIFGVFVLLVILIIQVGCGKKELSEEDKIRKAAEPKINEIISSIENKTQNRLEYVSTEIISNKEIMADYFYVKGFLYFNYSEKNIKIEFSVGVRRNSIDDFVVEASDYSIPNGLLTN